MERIASGRLAPVTHHDYYSASLLPRDVRRYDKVLGFALRWKH